MNDEGSPDEIIHFPCFGVRRYEGRLPSVALWPLDGSAAVLSYTFLLDVKLLTDNRLVVNFADCQAEIEGQKLRVLGEFLIRRAVRYVKAIANVENDADTWVNNIFLRSLSFTELCK